MTKAYCFDLDGTLTRREILPEIAVRLNLTAEIGALTEATIKGVIPFEASFRLRCRLLADVPVSEVRDIVATVPLFDEIADFIQTRRDQCYIITGNLDVWVDQLLDRLHVRSFTSTASVVNDRITGVTHVLDKGQAVEELRRNHSAIVAIGDGMGDIAMFNNSDIRIAFAGVHDPIAALAESADLICTSERSLRRVLEDIEKCDL